MSQLLFIFLTFNYLYYNYITYNYLSVLYIYLINLFIYHFLPSVIRRPLFLPLQSPALLSEMVRSAIQHCLCWPRKLTVLPKKGPV